MPATGFPVKINSSRHGRPATWSTSSISAMRLQLTSNVTNEYIFRNPINDCNRFCDNLNVFKLPNSKWQSMHSVIRFSHKLNELKYGSWFKLEMDVMWFRSSISALSFGSNWMLLSIDWIQFDEKLADFNSIQHFVGSILSALWMQSQSKIWFIWVVDVLCTAKWEMVCRRAPICRIKFTFHWVSRF